MVSPADFIRIREELAQKLLDFVDPETGKRPVSGLWRREELFEGIYAEDAPDLLLEPASLYILTHARRVVEAADWSSGDHRIDGVLVAAGGRVNASGFPETARLVDLAPTILAAAGAPASVYHAGTALPSVVDAPGSTPEESGAAEGDGEGTEPFSGLGDLEAKQIEEHLRGLGYLE